MPWHKSDEAVTFECDTCDLIVDCDTKTVRDTAEQPNAQDSDFAICWRYMQGIGWRSFKREGRLWAYHCPTCGPQAEVEHGDHRRLEDERERIRSRNAREAG